MKKHLSLLLSLALAAVLVPAAFAQSRGTSSAPKQDQTNPSMQSPSTPSAQSPSAAPSHQAPSEPSSSASSSGSSNASSSFNGTVVRSGDKLVLKTAIGDTYQIDDQDKAKQFEGKQVKVNGSLAKSTSVLHVTDITPADNR